MKILIIEPYFEGSHKTWTLDFQKFSAHDIELLTLPGRHWKWRMHGGAITLAQLFNEHISKNPIPDIILTTDMLNLPVFTSFIKINAIPIVTYFHENQLTYPWSSQDRDKLNKRDHHYGFINYTTALKSDLVMFNSDFHKNEFIHALTKFLKKFPDHRGINNVDLIKDKSVTAYLGLELKKFDSYRMKTINETPIILWNHRWEYDKNPELFFAMLKKIKDDGIDFGLVVLGENFSQSPSIFDKAKEIFKDNICHWGYSQSFSEYAKWLWKADILPVTSNQEFFGASVMEAIYCNTWPILPRRLTYPELIPIDNHSGHIYEDEKDLYEKIVRLISDQNVLKRARMRSVAKQFDWNAMALVYDKRFSKCV